MKQKGALMEHSEERVRDLMRAHDSYIDQCRVIRMPEVYKAIAEHKARRFYVSDTRANVVVTHLLKWGKAPGRMLPLKRMMYEEITRRVKQRMKEMPMQPVRAIVAQVVREPAPQFYITAGTAKVMVCKWKRKMKQLEQERWQQLFNL